MKDHPLHDRIRRIRRAIRARKPLAERIDLVRKRHAAAERVRVRVEGDAKNTVHLRINENA